MAQSQIIKLTVPQITDAGFSSSFTTLVDNINNNFEAIASLPYLKGAQGNSFVLANMPIFNTTTKKLTELGANLFNCIFNDWLTTSGSITEGKSWDNVKDQIKSAYQTEFGKCKSAFFTNDTLISERNTLYMYAISDDTGTLHAQYSGQYYYFIDPRIESLHTVLSSNDLSSLTGFNDLSGFFAYNGNTGTSGVIGFQKVNFVPTLYYDAENNDICWKFNGVETGISACGTKGADGNDSTYYIVKVIIDNASAISKEVSKVWCKDSGTSSTSAGWHEISDAIEWGYFPNPTKEGEIYNALICIENNSVSAEDFIFGWVFGNIISCALNPAGYTANWDKDKIITDTLYNSLAVNWIKQIGKSTIANMPRGIILPACANDQTKGNNVLWTRVNDTTNDMISLHLTYTTKQVTDGQLTKTEANYVYLSNNIYPLYIENYYPVINTGIIDLHNLFTDDDNIIYSNNPITLKYGDSSSASNVSKYDLENSILTLYKDSIVNSDDLIQVNANTIQLNSAVNGTQGNIKIKAGDIYNISNGDIELQANNYGGVYTNNIGIKGFDATKITNISSRNITVSISDSYSSKFTNNYRNDSYYDILNYNGGIKRLNIYNTTVGDVEYKIRVCYKDSFNRHYNIGRIFMFMFNFPMSSTTRIKISWDGAGLASTGENSITLGKTTKADIRLLTFVGYSNDSNTDLLYLAPLF